jgi:hypothetical protein
MTTMITVDYEKRPFELKPEMKGYLAQVEEKVRACVCVGVCVCVVVCVCYVTVFMYVCVYVCAYDGGDDIRAC